MFNIPSFFGFRAGDAFDSDYAAILAYAITQGYTLPSFSQQVLQNQLLIDLKDAGIWNKLDTLAVFATDAEDSPGSGTSDFALIDWKRLTDYTAVMSPTFTTNVGFKGDAISSRIDTNYTTNTNWVNVSQNNICAFANNSFDASPLQNVLVNTSSAYVLINTKSTTDTFQFRTNTSTTSTISPSPGALGRFYISRNNSANSDGYFNGVLQGNVASTSITDTLNINLLSNGAIAFYNTEIGYFGYCAYLDSTEIFNLDNALNTYLTSI